MSEVTLLLYPELKPRKGITFSASHISRLIRMDAFPKPVWLGANTRAWTEASIDEWIASRIGKRPVLGPPKSQTSRGLYHGKGRPVGSRVVDGRVVLAEEE